MIHFELNDEIQAIINQAKDEEKTIEALNFTHTIMTQYNQEVKDYRWQMLANHIAAMVDRSVAGEALQDIDPGLFEEIGETSLALAEKIVQFVGNLKEDEKFLLSVHFEAANT